jgi:Arc/MetJ-type ribon-helix-helix transcriptional regulator
MRHPPRVTGQGATVTVRLGPQLLKSLDEWRQGQLDLPSRSEAIRRLLLVAFTLKAMIKGVIARRANNY